MILIARGKDLIQLSLDRLTGANEALNASQKDRKDRKGQISNTKQARLQFMWTKIRNTKSKIKIVARLYSIMHLGVALWKDKSNRNYHPARHLCLVSPPWTPDREKKNRFQYNSSPITFRYSSPSQVKPLCLQLTSKTNTAQFRSTQTAQCKYVRQGGGQERNKNTNCSGAIWMFTCWIFYQFCFYLSLGVIYAAGTELCTGAAWSWLEQW